MCSFDIRLADFLSVWYCAVVLGVVNIICAPKLALDGLFVLSLDVKPTNANGFFVSASESFGCVVRWLLFVCVSCCCFSVNFWSFHSHVN